MNPFVKLMKISRGPHSPPLKDLLRHPFEPDNRKLFPAWFGDSTPDYKGCIWELFHSNWTFDSEVEFIFWMAEESPGQHQIWFEIRHQNECYLSSGLTDYSGSRHDYNELKELVGFMSEHLPCETYINSRVESMQKMNAAWASVNKQISGE